MHAGEVLYEDCTCDVEKGYEGSRSRGWSITSLSLAGEKWWGVKLSKWQWVREKWAWDVKNTDTWHCLGFPGGTRGKEPDCQSRRHKIFGFDPWIGKIPWKTAWKPTSVNLAWRIPWTEEAGGLHSKGLQKVGHDWSDLAHTHSSVHFIHVNVCYTSCRHCCPHYTDEGDWCESDEVTCPRSHK